MNEETDKYMVIQRSSVEKLEVAVNQVIKQHREVVLIGPAQVFGHDVYIQTVRIYGSNY